MYKEIVKSKGNRSFYKLVIIIAIALCLLWGLNALALHFGWQYRMLYQLASIVGICILVYPIIRHQLAEYYYCLDENHLVLNTKMGIRDIVLLNVALEDIKFIAPVGFSDYQNFKPFTVYEARKTIYKNLGYMGYFTEKNRLCKFYFEPSEEMVEILREYGVLVEA